MRYKQGYHYQTVEEFKVLLAGCPDIHQSYFKNGIWAINKYVSIEHGGDGLYWLYIASGYAWDGATGAVDTDNFMVPSMVHDAILELIGSGWLLYGPWKPWIDKFLIKLCKDRGMNWVRRQRVYWAVRLLGNPKGSLPKEIIEVI